MEPRESQIRDYLMIRALEVKLKYDKCSKNLFMMEMILKIITWITFLALTCSCLQSFIDANLNNNNFRQHETAFKVLCILNLILFILPIGLMIFIKSKLRKYSLEDLRSIIFFSMIQRLGELVLFILLSFEIYFFYKTCNLSEYIDTLPFKTNCTFIIFGQIVMSELVIFNYLIIKFYLNTRSFLNLFARLNNLVENQKEESKKKIDIIMNNLREVLYKEEDQKFMRDCQVCQETFEINEKIRILPCDGRHYFHTLCIFRLISSALEEGKVPQCPLCKAEIDNANQEKEIFEGNTGGREDPLLN